jgi:hypothetical protein
VNTDTFFAQGYSHHVCQDFALSNTRNKEHQIIGQPFAMVSDGCSSAPMTDIGSRLMCLTARKHLLRSLGQDTKSLLYAISSEISLLCEALGVEQECLYATLLATWVDDAKKMFRVLVIGDGAIVATKRNGIITTTEIRFPSGAPYYLKYEMDRASKDRYLATFGDRFEINKFDIHPEEGIGNYSTYKYQLDTNQPYFLYDFPLEEYQSVAVLTDGLFDLTKSISTATYKTEERVPVEDIVKEVVAFKGHCKGEFVKRRAEMSFKKFAIDNIRNRDDFAMGVISARDEVQLGQKE